MKLDIQLDRETLLESPNILEELDDEQVTEIVEAAADGFEGDIADRSDWDKSAARAMKLAMQVIENKATPWQGAANVKFPLITVASLNYHWQAFPALVDEKQLVKANIVAKGDKEDLQVRRVVGEKISRHMTYQLLEEDEDWFGDMDRALLVQPILGCVFKKVYFDAIEERNKSELVLPRHLVVPYMTKSLKTARRISHVIYMDDNDLYERAAHGIYLDYEDDEGLGGPVLSNIERLDQVADERQGVHHSRHTDDDLPHELVEQHLYLDLDGDGYKEPYILVFRRSDRRPYRLVARYDYDDINYTDDKRTRVKSIRRPCNFIKYPFIPSPDGGFYDLGLGALLTPMSASVDTSINAILDGMHKNVAGGGIIGRGARIQGGLRQPRPGEWLQADTTGRIEDHIYNWPKVDIPPALLSLLEVLINYGERIAGSTDAVMGQNLGQNTPAGTAATMREDGMKVFSSVYKRTFRAMKQEYDLLFELNKQYLPSLATHIQTINDERFSISRDDYVNYEMFVRPAASPELVSDTYRANKAQQVKALAMGNPNFNQFEVDKMVLKAMRIPEEDSLLISPDEQPPAPEDTKVTVAKIKEQSQIARLQMQAHERYMEASREAAKTMAEISKLEAEAQKIMAEAHDLAENRELTKIQTDLQVQQAKYSGLLEAAKFAQQLVEAESGEQAAARTGNAGVAPQSNNPSL